MRQCRSAKPHPVVQANTRRRTYEQPEPVTKPLSIAKALMPSELYGVNRYEHESAETTCGFDTEKTTR